MRQIIWIVLGTAALLSSPVRAWEHGFDETADGMRHWATASAVDGKAQLSFHCATSMPGAILAQLNTGRPGPFVRAPEFAIVVDGVAFGPLAARINESEGSLILVTDGPQDLVGQAARAAYASDGRVIATYATDTWTFDGASSAEAFGAMLDSCG